MKDIDLRKEVDYLLDRYGVKVLYVRSSKYIKCKCYDELYKAGHSSCKLCLGTGKVTSVEPITIFYNNEKYYSYLSVGGRYNTKVGEFILKYNSNPEFNDTILVVGYKNNIVVDVKKVYKITNANDVRCDNGRVEYYEVAVSTEDTLINKYNSYINGMRIDISKKRKTQIFKDWCYEDK